jgi:hypothetical protein
MIYCQTDPQIATETGFNCCVILFRTGYVNKKMAAYNDDCKKREMQVQGLEKWQKGKSVSTKQSTKDTSAASSAPYDVR